MLVLSEYLLRGLSRTKPGVFEELCFYVVSSYTRKPCLAVMVTLKLLDFFFDLWKCFICSFYVETHFKNFRLQNKLCYGGINIALLPFRECVLIVHSFLNINYSQARLQTEIVSAIDGAHYRNALINFFFQRLFRRKLNPSCSFTSIQNATSSSFISFNSCFRQVLHKDFLKYRYHLTNQTQGKYKVYVQRICSYELQ